MQDNKTTYDMKPIPFNTHTFKVAQWLRSGKSITAWEAIAEFGCTRLADVIYRLRNIHGFAIKDEIIAVKNRNGRTVKIAKYQLITE
jgi:hypothetical protein